MKAMNGMKAMSGPSLELRDAKIAKLVAYWAKPFPPAESRAPFVERRDE
jgi:hypothetical protein